jgi:predicted transcriptional regulator
VLLCKCPTDHVAEQIMQNLVQTRGLAFLAGSNTPARRRDAISNREYVTKIITAFAKQNTLAADQLPGLIAAIDVALSAAAGIGPAEPAPMTFSPAVSIKRAIKPNSIMCLDCGYEGKLLKRHLGVAHGLTPDAYRRRWGLKRDYSMTAPSYAVQRAALARSARLGKRKAPRPVAD